MAEIPDSLAVDAIADPSTIDDVDVPSDYTTESAPSVDTPPRAVTVAPAGATGRRKEAVARVRIVPGTGAWSVNGRSLEEYFPNKLHQQLVNEPFVLTGLAGRYDVVARIHGGGVSSQSGALRHGISRALLEADPSLRGELKRRGFLTRDSRVKERKKAGLKKARKAPQFSKR